MTKVHLIILSFSTLRIPRDILGLSILSRGTKIEGNFYTVIKKKILSEGRYRLKIFNNPPGGDYLEKGVKTGIGYPFGCVPQTTRVTNMHALTHQTGPVQDKVNDASPGC